MTVIVEAAQPSGSLITADRALAPRAHGRARSRARSTSERREGTNDLIARRRRT